MDHEVDTSNAISAQARTGSPDAHRLQEEEEWLIFVDEAGGEAPDPEYDALVLLFVLMSKKTYRRVVAEFKAILLNHFPHDGFVVHENALRHWRSSPYAQFMSDGLASSFASELGAAIEQWQFDLIASVIDKTKWRKLPQPPDEGMYAHALRRGLERVTRFTSERGWTSSGDMILESRDDAMNRTLYPVLGEYLGYADRQRFKARISWRFEEKKAGIVGLQLADLFARPIGLHVLRPEQPNRAVKALLPKFQRPSDPSSDSPWWRLDTFPPEVPMPPTRQERNRGSRR